MIRARRFVVLALFLSGCLCCLGAPGNAQSQTSAPDARRIVRRTQPIYPEVAKKMNLGGTVKVLATVAADGTVKTVQPMGGSPLLIQAAADAVYKWKFAPANGESKEPVELHFNSAQ